LKKSGGKKDKKENHGVDGKGEGEDGRKD